MIDTDYLDRRRGATILRDEGGYAIGNFEMNPVIFEVFMGLVLDSDLPSVIWEPFAGQIEHSPFQDLAEEVGVTLLSQTLCPKDPRIVRADSTVVGPSREIGGILFHPPYFGANPLNESDRDVSLASEKAAYCENLSLVVSRGLAKMAENGLVCAIGRDYRIGGERIHLDEWYLEIFRGMGFYLSNVWSSEPDIVLIFQRR